MLASIARQVKEKELVDRLVASSDLDALHEQLVGGFGGIRSVQAQQNRVNRLMFREAERVARGLIAGRLWFSGIPLWVGSSAGRSSPS